MKRTDPYLPADKLRISEEHRQVLIELARNLAAENIIPASEWNMSHWAYCICGHMVKRGISESSFGGYPGSQIYRLFNPPWPGKPTNEITQPEAARACYNFLTTGEPHWLEACAEKPIS